jgi:hypothetical protein
VQRWSLAYLPQRTGGAESAGVHPAGLVPRSRGQRSLVVLDDGDGIVNHKLLMLFLVWVAVQVKCVWISLVSWSLSRSSNLLWM